MKAKDYAARLRRCKVEEREREITAIGNEMIREVNTRLKGIADDEKAVNIVSNMDKKWVALCKFAPTLLNVDGFKLLARQHFPRLRELNL